MSAFPQFPQVPHILHPEVRLLRVPKNSTMPKHSQAPPKSYQCHRCSRLFSRSEHLQRHERSRGYQYFCSRTQSCIDISLQIRKRSHFGALNARNHLLESESSINLVEDDDAHSQLEEICSLDMTVFPTVRRQYQSPYLRLLFQYPTLLDTL